MLYIPVPINPADDEKATVSNSGTEVAKPAIFPDAFAPKFNSCDIFLNTGTSKYLAIITIPKDNNTNFINSTVKAIKILPYLYF